MICPHCGGLIAWKSIDPDKTAKIIQLHKSGHSLRDIADKLDVSFSSAGRIIRQHLADKGKKK